MQIGLTLKAWIISSLFIMHAKAQQNTPVEATKVQASFVTALLPGAYPQNIQVNFIRTWEAKKPVQEEVELISSNRAVDEVNRATQYFDGLGRPLQNVLWQISPNKKDIITPLCYDDFGRESNTFLAYTSGSNAGNFQSNPFNGQKIFYTSAYPTEQPAYSGEEIFYSKTVFEPSPLNRVQKLFAPGNSWAGSEGSDAEHAIKMDYLVNTTDEHVKIWTIGFDLFTFTNADVNNNIPVADNEYGEGRLFKMVTTDEEGQKSIVYKDIDGRIILKKVQIDEDISDKPAYDGWLCTYYVYDDLGLLRFVIPPKAVEWLSKPENSWSFSNTEGQQVVAELCFRYEYDARRNITAKKVPGADWIYVIYNKQDLPVYTQDGNLRAKNEWMYTVYDLLNRPVETGILSGFTQGYTLLKGHISNIPYTSTFTGNTPSSIDKDIFLTELEPGRTLYQASNSIESGSEIEIDGTVTLQIVESNEGTFTNSQTVNAYPFFIDNITKIPLTETFYDNYAWCDKTFSSNYNADLSTNESFPDPLLSTQNNFVSSMVTGTRVRVLTFGNNTELLDAPWLETANFYDDKGRIVQMQSDNYKGGKDVITNRYDFSGKLLVSYNIHNNPGGNTNNLGVATAMFYDHADRLTSIKKTVAGTEHEIVKNEYDALGKLKHKEIGKKRLTDGSLSDTESLEDQQYTYNIRGWLKGINWQDYGAVSGSTKPSVSISNNKWFSMDLSYDWGFNNAQYNGNIAGQKWKTASGDDEEQRAFGYGYDATNRLLFADFKQHFTNGWGITKDDFTINFSCKMGDGQDYRTAYDANGNIKHMEQNGLLINRSPLIDDLSYNYFDNNDIYNKLRSVTDNKPDNKLGDFTDKNKTGDDYSYDVNGNLKKDLNKEIGDVNTDGIEYNLLNLPYQVTVKNKGTINYIYDATGNKLEKITNEPASVINDHQKKITNTTYLGGYIYENNVLKFFSHEEGRVRKKVTVNAQPQTEFVYDYFLKDHLGNVRVVLTDEYKTDPYPIASLENLSVEKQVYSIPDDNGTRVRIEDVPGYPTDNTTDPNEYVHKLSGNSTKIGTSIVLKVMAGDKFNIRANSWYKTAPNTNPYEPVNPLNEALAVLKTGIVSTGPGTHNITETTLQDDAILGPGLTNFFNDPENRTLSLTKPKAYLNWILLDENFHYVSNSSSAEQVPDESYFNNDQIPDNRVYKHVKNDLPITKNGYLYVYVSNETPNIDVFFDNLQVTHIRGPLLEETHYYPFGLTMAGISSKAANITINKEKTFQGQRFDDDLGLNYVQFKYRNHDPQIGRFIEIDPLSEKYVYNSPYAFSENKVTSHVELEGLESVSLNPTDYLWRDAGISSSSDPVEFISNVGKESLKPSNWVAGYSGAGQIALPIVLTTLMTGGIGNGPIFQAEIETLGPLGPVEIESPALIGGRKGDIPTKIGFDRHEIPSAKAMRDALGINTNDVPALQLPTEIHAQTETFGFKPGAAQARATETALIKSGNINQAFANGVKDVQKVIQTPQAQQVLKTAGLKTNDVAKALYMMAEYFNKTF